MATASFSCPMYSMVLCRMAACSRPTRLPSLCEDIGDNGEGKVSNTRSTCPKRSDAEMGLIKAATIMAQSHTDRPRMRQPRKNGGGCVRVWAVPLPREATTTTKRNHEQRGHDRLPTHQHLSPQRHQPILELFCPALLHSVVAGAVVIAGWWGWGEGRRHWVWGRNTGRRTLGGRQKLHEGNERHRSFGGSADTDSQWQYGHARSPSTTQTGRHRLQVAPNSPARGGGTRCCWLRDAPSRNARGQWAVGTQLTCHQRGLQPHCLWVLRPWGVLSAQPHSRNAYNGGEQPHRGMNGLCRG